MVSHYTVVQYVPRPLADERINLGVIAWADGQISAKFIEDWRRARGFGGEDIDFARDFARRVQEAVEASPELPGLEGERIDEDRLRKYIGTWMHSLQFSAIKTSLKRPAEVINEVAPVFLREPHRRPRRVRDRRFAAAFAAHQISKVLQEVAKKSPAGLIHRNHELTGKLDRHVFDVVVANGKPFFAAQGLSFEIDPHILNREIDATAWAIDDVRKEKRAMPLAVVAVRPLHGKIEAFDRAVHVFEGLNADVLRENDVERWAKRVAKETDAIRA